MAKTIAHELAIEASRNYDANSLIAIAEHAEKMAKLFKNSAPNVHREYGLDAAKEYLNEVNDFEMLAYYCLKMAAKQKL